MRKNRKNEKGIALILVLGVTAMFSMIITSMVIRSKVSQRLGYINANSGKHRYYAESALSRTLWLLKKDRDIHRNRRLGQQEILEEQAEEEERWQADGTPHYMQFGKHIAKITLYDADQGMQVEGTITGSRRRRIKEYLSSEDEEQDQIAEEFLDKLQDYTDRDDVELDYGAERAFYMDENGMDLPRDRQMQYTEEILWVPGIVNAVFHSVDEVTDELRDNIFKEFRIIPPRGFRFSSSNRPSFFSSSLYQIQNRAQLEDEEMEVVKEAKDLWAKDRTPVEETLGDLYTTIARYFSFNESNIYRIEIECSLKDGSGKVKMSVIVDGTRVFVSPSGSSLPHMNFWRKLLY